MRDPYSRSNPDITFTGHAVPVKVCWVGINRTWELINSTECHLFSLFIFVWGRHVVFMPARTDDYLCWYSSGRIYVFGQEKKGGLLDSLLFEVGLWWLTQFFLPVKVLVYLGRTVWCSGWSTHLTHKRFDSQLPSSFSPSLLCTYNWGPVCFILSLAKMKAPSCLP